MDTGHASPSPEQLVEMALLRMMVTNGFEPVREEQLAEALPELGSEELRATLARLVEKDMMRHVPEGWVMRGHGPKHASSRARLLLKDPVGPGDRDVGADLATYGLASERRPR